MLMMASKFTVDARSPTFESAFKAKKQQLSFYQGQATPTGYRDSTTETD